MIDDEMLCPKYGEETWRDEVDGRCRGGHGGWRPRGISGGKRFTVSFTREICVTWNEYRQLTLLDWECNTKEDLEKWNDGSRDILGKVVDSLTWGDPLRFTPCSKEEIVMPDRSRRPVHKLMSSGHNKQAVARTYCGVDPYRKGVLAAFNENPEFGPKVTCEKCLKAEADFPKMSRRR